jgi:hypothetical protein
MDAFLDRLMQLDCIKNKPPVLIDIGASGCINGDWKDIAKYAICIAFDADDREMSYTENNKDYLKQYVFHCAVTDKEVDTVKFYLTKSPYCSSTLKPDLLNLRKYSFYELFEIVGEKEVKARTLTSVLSELKIDYVDWFKTDSQGTDLRLFNSLPFCKEGFPLIAEMEPGFMDAYVGEDLAGSAIGYMTCTGYWLCDMEVLGPERVNTSNFKDPQVALRFMYGRSKQKKIPGWCKLVFMLESSVKLADRDVYLLFVIACLKQQYGYAVELLLKYKNDLDTTLLPEMSAYISKKLMENS